MFGKLKGAPFRFSGKGGGGGVPVNGVVVNAFKYSSSIDSITNLYASYAFDNTKTNLPVVVLMHGYDQDAGTFTLDVLRDMAAYGLFVVAPGMRGRNGAGGTRDTSARELYDVYDAVEYVKTNFAAYVDVNNINISGYSGGGGNAFGLITKFPDYWRVVASHFGISDYGHDPTNSWYVIAPTRQESLAQWIGGTPAQVPDAYRARAHQYGVGKNLQGGYLYMFHDQDDNNVPVVQSTLAKQQLDANSRTNYAYNVTTSASPIRWIHNSPDLNQPVRFSRDIWGPPIKAGTYPAWTIADSGSLHVQGYVKTKKFSIWLGDGKAEVADVTYNVTTNSYTVTPLTGSMAVTIRQGAKTATQTISAATTLTVA